MRARLQHNYDEFSIFNICNKQINNFFSEKLGINIKINDRDRQAADAPISAYVFTNNHHHQCVERP